MGRRTRDDRTSPQDLERIDRRIIAALGSGSNATEIARALGRPPTWVQDRVVQLRAAGRLPAKTGGR